MLEKYITELKIDVDTYTRGHLLNSYVKPDSTIRSISWKTINTFDGGNFVEASREDLNQKCYEDSTITIRSNEEEKTFYRENGFTVQDIFDCILEVEEIARPKTIWFEGIDAHHVFFEGLSYDGENAYSVNWGS